MPAQILRESERDLVPWKNGLGTTAEILISPADATLDTFDWRLSIADVTSFAAFSPLPGIDRTLVPILGGGIRLVIDGDETAAELYEPVRFSGEADVSGGPLGDPCRDLNLMVRRGASSGSLRIERVTDPIKLELSATAEGAAPATTSATTIVAVVLAGSVVVGGSALVDGASLEPRDALVLTASEASEAGKASDTAVQLVGPGAILAIVEIG